MTTKRKSEYDFNGATGQAILTDLFDLMRSIDKAISHAASHLSRIYELTGEYAYPDTGNGCTVFFEWTRNCGAGCDKTLRLNFGTNGSMIYDTEIEWHDSGHNYHVCESVFNENKFLKYWRWYKEDSLVVWNNWKDATTESEGV